MSWTPEQARRHKAAAKAVADINHSTAVAVDNFTDSLDTLLTAIAQRDMTPDQIDRLAALLQRAERDLLRRIAAPARSSNTPRRSATRAPRKAA